jgi:hypothetical protein
MSVKIRSFKQEDWEMVANIVSANKQVNENWHAMQTSKSMKTGVPCKQLF